MPARTLKIGTRGSPLALIQARLAAAALRKAAGGRLHVEIVPIATTGDKLAGRSLAEEGGKGLFIKEIEEALLRGAVDVAVHSAKDLPAAVPKGLALAAFLKREDPHDAFVSRRFKRLADLPLGAKVGTSSLRRQAQLLAARPDLHIMLLRGNVETRLAKIDRGDADATLLACAGLNRLKKTRAISERLSVNVMLPAPGQGAIALEARAGDRTTLRLLKKTDHAATRACVLAERGLVEGLGASCTMPLGGLAHIAKGRLSLHAALFSPDGRLAVRVRAAGTKSAAFQIGRRAAKTILKKAPRGLLKSLKLA
jgi:hydroxymethylbilane synthase